MFRRDITEMVEREKETDTQTERQTETEMDRERETETETDRQTNRQTDRTRDRQKQTYLKVRTVTKHMGYVHRSLVQDPVSVQTQTLQR